MIIELYKGGVGWMGDELGWKGRMS